MSRATAEISFRHFCEKFSEGLWDAWVKLPEGDELKKAEDIYRRCGYPGAIGSVDCTHYKWEGCPFSERTIHTGKEGYATVVVESTCDHSGRIIAATKSYPGAENDTTIVQRDKAVWQVQRRWHADGVRRRMAHRGRGISQDPASHSPDQTVQDHRRAQLEQTDRKHAERRGVLVWQSEEPLSALQGRYQLQLSREDRQRVVHGVHSA
ncbi:unnamed protein product [Pylaiella littoralis]